MIFIAIDGIDGAGKTTLAGSLAAILKPLNPLVEKEPTDQSEWGRRLKESAAKGRLPKEVELEFFHKDRVQHVEKVIKPALAAGRIVIVDRYVDSTLAFQTKSAEEAERLYVKLLPDILEPDVTFILDCPVKIGLQRIAKSRDGYSKFETTETLLLAQRIYRSRRGPRYEHINASRSADETLEDAVNALRDRFPRLRRFLPDALTSSSELLTRTATAR